MLINVLTDRSINPACAVMRYSIRPFSLFVPPGASCAIQANQLYCLPYKGALN